MNDSLLHALIKERLGSVAFNMSGVELVFGNARFMAYVWPSVIVGETPLQLGDSGYRDALCAFIEQAVTGVDESAERGLVIQFGLGEIITRPCW